MKKILALSLACLVLGLAQVQAAEVVLQDDFETYAVDDAMNALAKPWTVYVRPADRMVDNTAALLGTTFTAKVANALVGGGKAGQIVDGNATDVMEAAITSDALKNRNSGQGIRKGSVQIDWLMPTAGVNCEFHVVDNDFMLEPLPPTVNSNEVNKDQVVEIYTTGTGALRVFYAWSADGIAFTSVSTDLAAPASGDAYRINAHFDMDTKELNMTIKKWDGSAYATTLFDTATLTLPVGNNGKVYIRAASVSPFDCTGVRGLKIITNTTVTPTFQFDNVIFTDDEAVANVADWMTY